MRIVAGAFRGRRLAAVRGSDVRPTSDKVREAVFSILADVEGEVVLDLFAGTGALGLEALSRGAASATFVEQDRAALEVVHRNIDATVTDGRHAATVVKGDAPRVVRSLALAGDRFDLVFFDPPYEHTKDLVAATADDLPTVLAPDARIVLELASRHAGIAAEAARGWGAEVELERSWGDTAVAILRAVDVPETDVEPTVLASDDAE